MHPFRTSGLSGRESWCFAVFLGLLFPFFTGLVSQAGTVVKLGSVTPLTGPADLDLDGEIIYAINFSSDDPVRTLRGIKFLPDTQRITGVTLVGPQQVAPWMTKPEFGASADANQLEEILQDIRWANSGASERLRATLAVTNGQEYKVQILISGNNPEDRRWDIKVGGREAVDEITSLGVAPGQSYAINRATLYTCQIVATNTSLVIEMGNLFGANDGGDRNPIWQALILKRVFIPPTPDDIVLTNTQFFPTQTAYIDRFRVLDRKSNVSHVLSLVSGAGDTDNAKFVLAGNELRPGAFNFAAQAPGTSYSLRVRATDAADATRVLEKTFTLTLATAHAPTLVTLDAASLNAQARAGALAARIGVQDSDPFDRPTVQMEAGVGGEENSFFTVSGTELRFLKAPTLGLTQCRVRLRAVDLSGLSVSASFTLPLVQPKVRINELLGSTLGGVTDEADEPQDWIELHNQQPHWVDLSGWYLSDSSSTPTQWAFPSGVIPPNGFLLVLADGLGVAPVGSSLLHANFALSAGGGHVSLTLPDGLTAMSRLDAPEFYPGVTYGLDASDKPGYLLLQTPGATNSAPAEAGANLVQFDKPHGFYTNSFLLTLTASVSNSVIRYTLDGTVPTVSKGIIYTNPIPLKPNTNSVVRGTRIVRAVAFSPKAAYAPVNTQTYLFINGETSPTADGVIGQSQLTTTITKNAVYGPLMDDALYALPTLSLVIPLGLDTAEHLASIELFDPARQEDGFQVDCGVSATGTTSLGSPKLSMSAKFRSEYGHSKLRYPMFARGSLFPEGAATEFNELRIRSHSHDTFYWLGTVENPPVPYGDPPVNRSGDAQLARNPWIDEMQLLMGQPGKHGRQVHLYLNGAYHGIYHIHEHADEDFMASYFPGSREDYHFTAAVQRGSEHGAGDSWTQPWTALKASLGNYAEAKRWVDVTNLCDYMLLSFYAGNDWDWSLQHNWSAAGPRFADRGGWKFFQQDSDITLQDIVADCTDQDVPDGIFSALMNQPDFRSLFRDRAYLHCYNNGALTPAVASRLYDIRMNEISNAIVAETARWQPSSSVSALPWDRNQEWMNEWKYIRETYFPQRTARLIDQFRKHPNWWPVDPPAFSGLGGVVPLGFRVGVNTDVGVVYYTTDGSDPRLPGGGINPKAVRLNTTLLQTRLVRTNTLWRFLDTGADPGPTWTGAAFDDTTWRSGNTEIGYGDGGEATVAAFVDTDPALTGIQRNITTYFRKAFDAPGFESLTSLKVRLVRDDGAVVYLNGVEILRTNMPAGVITNGTRALVDISSTADESTFLEYVFRPDQLPLKASNNIVAVEMHQRLPTSTDMSFNLELIGYTPAPGANIAIQGPTLVRARTFGNNDWSSLVESYWVPDTLPRASSGSLLLTEIHYAPAEDTANEFLEFKNDTAFPLDLSDVVVTQAVSFVFPKSTVLAAQERVLVVRDPALFVARYQTNASPYYRAGLRVLGPWDGSLNNAGETLEVRAADGSLVFTCTYGPDLPWPTRSNGKGSSLELVESDPAPADVAGRSLWLSDAAHWRASRAYHGSPGIAGDVGPAPVVINEILSASAAPDTDALELLNVGPAEVDVSGWFVSDGADNYRKYRIPASTRLAPGARLVLRESDFNRVGNPACLVPFAFSSGGESVFLLQANTNGALLRFSDAFDFGATPRGVSLGRWPDGVGSLFWLQAQTFGAANAKPVAGYEAWAAVSFPPGTTSDKSQPDADPDGDGFLNYWEYVFALSPLRADSNPMRVLGVSPDGGLLFSYRTRTIPGELVYALEVSEDLVTWTPAQARVTTLSVEPGVDAASVVRASLKGSGPATFVRLRVTP